MSGISPAAVLYSSDGYELNVTLNNSIPAGTRGILTLGSDGTNARPLQVNTAGVVSIQGVAGGTAIPVSGSITATNAAVSTTGAAAPGSASLSGALVVSATPTYTAGNMNALNVTTAGRLLIDGSQVTQPVSGTVTANAGTGTFTVGGTVTANAGTGNFNVIGTGSAGSAATGVVTIQGISGMTAVNVAGTTTIADTFANPTTAIGTQAFEMVWNGTTWDRLRAAATGAGTGAGLGIMRVLPHDGTNGAAIKAASTAPVAADPALVVALSPNGNAVDGYVTTAAPSYTTGTTNYLSLDTNGSLRVNVTTGTITASSASTGTDGAAALTFDTQVGGKVTTAAPTYTTGNLNALSLTTLGGLRIDGVYAVATANATAADVANVGGYVTTAAPTYTTGQLNPLSLTTAGALRVDGSAVTQPVSGTVTANQGGTWTVQPGNTANTTPWLVTGSGTAGTAATGVLTVQGIASMTPIQVSQATAANLNATVVQGTASNLRAQTAAESATSAAIPAFADFVGANVVSSAPTYTAGNLNGLTMTTAGRLIVDGSQVTQPVSGTVTANAGTGTFTVAGTVTANAGTGNFTVVQSTAASLNATVVGTGTGGAVSVAQATAANLNATVVGAGTAGTPNTGVVTVQGITGGTKLPVITDTSSTATITSVASSTSNTTILAANANRVLATIFNGANKTMYLALGTTASTSSYTIQLAVNAYWELPLSYTGAISAVWANGVSGNALVTELT